LCLAVRYLLRVCYLHDVISFLIPPLPPSSTLFPYTTLFRSWTYHQCPRPSRCRRLHCPWCQCHRSPWCWCYRSLRTAMERHPESARPGTSQPAWWHQRRSEEHTSELQSRFDLVCRLLLEKKN